MSPAMANAPALAPLSEAEADAVRAHKEGADHSTISALTGLGRAAIDKAIERDRLIRLNGPKYPPLSSTEAEAVRLHGERMATMSIAMRTGLTVDQVRAAIERDKILRLVPGARNRPPAPTAALPLAHTPATALLPEPEPPTIPKARSGEKEASAVQTMDVEPVDGQPAAAAEPEAADGRPVVAIKTELVVDEQPAIEQLLARAEASLQPRARTIAADIRRQVAQLTGLLDNDERIRTLTIESEVLRRRLTDTQRELAELLGDAGAAPDTRAVVDWDAKLADEPEQVPPLREETDANLSYSAEVRAWAKANGWDVRPSGRIGGAIVAAYRNAHPTGGAS